jgi:hypothetical protein
MSNDSFTHPFMSSSILLRCGPKMTLSMEFQTWEDLARAREVAPAMTRRRDRVVYDVFVT